jgi:hypothetical protein
MRTDRDEGALTRVLYRNRRLKISFLVTYGLVLGALQTMRLLDYMRDRKSLLAREK